MSCQQTCALRGCSKPPAESRHLACGQLHQNLLMAGRFNPSVPHPYSSILERNGAAMCALHSCSKPPLPDHSWCSKSHYLVWLKDFTSSLLPDQRCKLPRCTMHVFVDDHNNPLQFCGWNHCQKSVMLSASQNHQSLSLNAAHLCPSSSPSSSQVIQDEYNGGDHVPPIKSLIQSLKGFASPGVTPRNIKVDMDFFSKHPWEVFREKEQVYLSIVQRKFSSKGTRAMHTKDGYHWKQTGRPAKRDCGGMEKNYVYEKTGKRKEKGLDDQHEQKMMYRMKEYTLESLKSYSLVVCKVKPSSNRRNCRGKPGEGSCAEINNVTSPHSITSNLPLLDDEFSVDSLLKDLPLDYFDLPLDYFDLQSLAELQPLLDDSS